MTEAKVKRLVELRSQVTARPWVVTNVKDGYEIYAGKDASIKSASSGILEFITLAVELADVLEVKSKKGTVS
jgi:hypothetical protein